MANIQIFMNGSEVLAPQGVTILEAAKSAGIDIPTLCHHPKLQPTGACRICVVEVTGQRSLVAACAFPIFEGMEIQTESPKVVAARKLILDMLFAERNHYCPFCEMSGDCELQNLGYRYGIDHWVYPTYIQGYPVDASRPYFMMDQNRCILCQRCVRACNELVANHTLGLSMRGARAMVNADANTPFAESTCISCGTCLQVCPVGSLADRRSSFMGRSSQTDRTKSVCNRCSIGCGTSIVSRGGNVLRIEGDWDAPINEGLLCKSGRFDPLYDTRKRVSQPMIRRGKRLEPASWEEAFAAIAQKMGNAGAAEIGLLVSGDATNEALYLAGKLFKGELSAKNVGLISGAATKLTGQAGTFNDLTGSKLILLVGANPAVDQPVASFLVKRLVDKGTRLIVVDDGENGLAPFAETVLKMEEIDKAVEAADSIEGVAVLYGTGVTEKAAQALKKLEAKASFIALEPGVNTRAAVAFGMNNGFQASAAKVLFTLVGDSDCDGGTILDKVDNDAYLIVQAGFASSLTDRADVVLPSAIWSERSGSLTNTEGLVQMANSAVAPEGEAKPDWEILSLLAEKLGKNIGASFDEISARAAQELK